MTQAAPSLARVLLRRLLAVFALAFVGSCAAFLMLARWDPTIPVEESIGDLAQQLAAATKPGPGGRLTLQPDKALAETLRDKALRYVVVERATGRVVAQSVRPLAEFAPALPASGERRMAFSIVTPGERSTARLDGFVAERDGAVFAAVAVERAHFWHLVAWIWEELIEDILPVGVPLLVLTLAVAAVTIRRTLRPVTALSNQARAITPRTTGLRLDQAKVPAEVLPLVAAFNAALDRLDRGFTMQRRFTANAAHQLRTPLAILRARLDGMAAAPGTAELKRDCDRIARVVSQLLAIARLEAHEIEISEAVDLVRLARETAAAMAPLAIAEGRSVSLDAGAAAITVRGNSAALADALGNLIENALRFSPPGGTVEVAVRPGAALSVLDRGPGVPPQERARVFEPFWRGADPRGAGSGLGLAIVAEIAAAHGGRALALDRAGGGAEFRIELPQIALPLPHAGQAQAAQ
jgi:signal transduction histidine kinase